MNPRKLTVMSLMASACSLTMRMLTGSLCGIKISLCFLGVQQTKSQSDITRFTLK
jgi:hypothetical protein